MNQPAIDRMSIISQGTNVLARKVRGETVLLNLETEQYYALNESGTEVWQLIAEGTSLDGICDRLSQHYAVAPQQLERDLIELLPALLDAQLITIAGARREDPA